METGEGISAGEIPRDLGEQLKKLSAQIEESNKRVDDFDLTIASLRQDFVTSDQLKELKYVIDSINPLEYVTVQQVKDMIDERTGKKKKV